MSDATSKRRGATPRPANTRRLEINLDVATFDQLRDVARARAETWSSIAIRAIRNELSYLADDAARVKMERQAMARKAAMSAETSPNKESDEFQYSSETAPKRY